MLSSSNNCNCHFYTNKSELILNSSAEVINTTTNNYAYKDWTVLFPGEGNALTRMQQVNLTHPDPFESCGEKGSGYAGQVAIYLYN